MDNYIVINGRKAELTEEQLKALGIVVEKNPFDRLKRGDCFYFIDSYGKVSWLFENCSDQTKNLYSAANYCTDKDLLQQRAYAETLNRLLWRYSKTHRGEVEGEKGHFYYVMYNYVSKKWTVDHCVPYNYLSGDILFDTQEIAESAIKEVAEPFMKEHPDFIPRA